MTSNKTSDTVIDTADLSIQATPPTAVTDHGAATTTFDARFTATNLGPSTATATRVTVTFPTANLNAGTPTGCTMPATDDPDDGSFVCIVGDTAPTTQALLTFPFTSQVDGTYAIQATVASDDFDQVAGNNQGTFSQTVRPSADLAFVSSGKQLVGVAPGGDPSRQIWRLTFQGGVLGQTDAPSTVMTITVPTGLDAHLASIASDGVCASAANAGETVLTCRRKLLAPGETFKVAFDVTWTAGNTTTDKSVNGVLASGIADPVPSNNQTSVTVCRGQRCSP